LKNTKNAIAKTNNTRNMFNVIIDAQAHQGLFSI
jgi:hypothetical protein